MFVLIISHTSIFLFVFPCSELPFLFVIFNFISILPYFSSLASSFYILFTPSFFRICLHCPCIVFILVEKYPFYNFYFINQFTIFLVYSPFLFCIFFLLYLCFVFVLLIVLVLFFFRFFIVLNHHLLSPFLWYPFFLILVIFTGVPIHTFSCISSEGRIAPQSARYDREPPNGRLVVFVDGFRSSLVVASMLRHQIHWFPT